MTATPPPWELVRSLVDAAVDVGPNPAAVSNLDQMQAWLERRLDYLELDVRDDRTLYEVFVVLGVIYELARGAADADQVTRDEELGVKRLTLTIAAALSRLLPEEARP